MTDKLRKLLDSSRNTSMSAEQQRDQRESFAYGNTHFENENITRDTVRDAARELAKGNDASN